MVDQLNSIACLTCRSKKIKCDRTLPACSQCIASGVDCNYPQGNKRGIPTGYISSLEKRLLQTETALFDALSRIHGITSEQASDFTNETAKRLQSLAVDQNRSDRLQEWQQYPLATEEQRLNWLYARMTVVDNIADPAWQQLDQSLSQSVDPPHEQHIGYSMQTSLSPHTEGSTWSSPSHPMAGGIDDRTLSVPQSYTSGNTEPQDSSSEAQRLSVRQSNRYF